MKTCQRGNSAAAAIGSLEIVTSEDGYYPSDVARIDLSVSARRVRDGAVRALGIKTLGGSTKSIPIRLIAHVRLSVESAEKSLIEGVAIEQILGAHAAAEVECKISVRQLSLGGSLHGILLGRVEGGVTQD